MLGLGLGLLQAVFDYIYQCAPVDNRYVPQCSFSNFFDEKYVWEYYELHSLSFSCLIPSSCLVRFFTPIVPSSTDDVTDRRMSPPSLLPSL
jgi:hypothetical protein